MSEGAAGRGGEGVEVIGVRVFVLLGVFEKKKKNKGKEKKNKEKKKKIKNNNIN